jgi:carbamoyl-phosphate synthase small subunit
MSTERKPARLILEDGTVMHGRSFGAQGSTIGELVFNTSLTGYQEILTDPSYRGQGGDVHVSPHRELRHLPRG